MIIFSLFIILGFCAQKRISALKAAERIISDINLELTQILNTSTEAMRVIASDFSVLRVNNTFLQLTELRDEQVMNHRCHEVFPNKYCHTDNCPMARFLAGEKRIEYDSEIQNGTGQMIPYIVTVTPFKDIEGKIVGIVECYKDISERKKAEKELQNSHEQLRRLASHMEQVREQERMGLARELHDELGQAVTGLQMDTAWMQKHLQSPESIQQEKLSFMQVQLKEIIHSIQRISSELRPKLLDDLGLIAAMEWQGNEIHKRLGIVFDVVSIPDEIILDEKCRITVFRIFQEAVTNIVRHANATLVDILFIHEENDVRLTITDNGVGIDPGAINNLESFGLIGMQERATLINGTLSIDNNIPRGTIVSLTIPYINCMEAHLDQGIDC